MKALILMTLLTFNSVFGANFYYDEFDLAEFHSDSRQQIDGVLEKNQEALPFQVMQDLTFLRHRLGKRPKIINREDEIPWIRHDVFLINGLVSQLNSYQQNENVLGLIQSFLILEKQYKDILRLHATIAK